MLNVCSFTVIGKDGIKVHKWTSTLVKVYFRTQSEKKCSMGYVLGM